MKYLENKCSGLPKQLLYLLFTSQNLTEVPHKQTFPHSTHNLVDGKAPLARDTTLSKRHCWCAHFDHTHKAMVTRHGCLWLHCCFNDSITFDSDKQEAHDHDILWSWSGKELQRKWMWCVIEKGVGVGSSAWGGVCGGRLNGTLRSFSGSSSGRCSWR